MSDDPTHDLDNISLLDHGLKLRLLHDEVGDEIRLIVDKFLEILPIRLQTLRAYHAAGDTVNFTIEAHRLKGAAATLGAERMGALCAHLEARAKTGILPDPRQLQRLTEMAPRVAEAMNHIVRHFRV
ncbi:MAG: Hpt domain-containing protein [Magnetococcus sp. YQC-9]